VDPLTRLQVRFGTLERGGMGRSLAELRATFARYADDVRQCYARSLRHRTGLKGELWLQLDVRPEGYTSGGGLQPPKVVESSLGAPELNACIESSAALWRFPRADLARDLIEPVKVLIELDPGT
jgi:hypothetical protein